MKDEIILNGIYEHYKRRQYLVLPLANDFEDFRKYVVYRKLYVDFDYRERLKRNFLGDVEQEGVEKERFKFIELKK